MNNQAKTGEAKMNDAYKTTYHRDGTVTLWNVYAGSWQRLSAGSVSDAVMATLTDTERKRIAKMAAR